MAYLTKFLTILKYWVDSLTEITTFTFISSQLSHTLNLLIYNCGQYMGKYGTLFKKPFTCTKAIVDNNNDKKDACSILKDYTRTELLIQRLNF